MLLKSIYECDAHWLIFISIESKNLKLIELIYSEKGLKAAKVVFKHLCLNVMYYYILLSPRYFIDSTVNGVVINFP